MDGFFDDLTAGRAKIRVMFTQNQFLPTGLRPEQRRAEYHLLYYQFIKHFRANQSLFGKESAENARGSRHGNTPVMKVIVASFANHSTLLVTQH